MKNVVKPFKSEEITVLPISCITVPIIKHVGITFLLYVKTESDYKERPVSVYIFELDTGFGHWMI